MYDKLKEMLESFTEIDLAATSNYRAMKLIHHVLCQDYHWTAADAECLAVQMEIDLPADFTDEQIEGLVTPFCKVANKLAEALEKDGFNVSSVLALIAKKFNLKLSQ